MPALILCLYTYRCEAKGIEVLGSSFANEHGLNGFASNISIAELVQRGRSTLLAGRGEGGSGGNQRSKDKGLHFRDNYGDVLLGKIERNRKTLDKERG